MSDQCASAAVRGLAERSCARFPGERSRSGAAAGSSRWRSSSASSSPARRDEIAAGIRVAGVNVAGLTPEEAAAALEQQAARYGRAGRRLHGRRASATRCSPKDLDATVDWAAVAAAAQSRGDWPMPFRGIRRVGVRLFGAEVTPVAELYEPRLEYELDRMAKSLDTPGRNAAIMLRGSSPRSRRTARGRRSTAPGPSS